jgi:hypothetical protein
MKRHIQRINNVLRDSNKKPFFTIVKEVVLLWRIKKQFPLYYFGRFFYRKGAQDARNFMNLKEYSTIVNHIVEENKKSPEVSDLLDNKLKFYSHCKTHDIPTADIVCHNFGREFHFNNEITHINSAQELHQFFIHLLNTINETVLFLKPFIANSGKGALKIYKESIDAEALWEILSQTNYIQQRVIVPHSDIRKIYAKSINTLRIETFVDKNGTFNYLGHYMRFGSGGSFVDNVNQGGFYVNVNLETGTLAEHGETNLILGAKIMTKHPDTGYPFKDFKIPHFEEALALVKKAAKSIPTYIQAWDVVFTPNGPILLEGNNFPSMITGEYSYGGYKNKPEVFKELLEPR